MLLVPLFVCEAKRHPAYILSNRDVQAKRNFWASSKELPQNRSDSRVVGECN